MNRIICTKDAGISTSRPAEIFILPEVPASRPRSPACLSSITTTHPLTPHLACNIARLHALYPPVLLTPPQRSHVSSSPPSPVASAPADSVLLGRTRVVKPHGVGQGVLVYVQLKDDVEELGVGVEKLEVGTEGFGVDVEDLVVDEGESMAVVEVSAADEGAVEDAEGVTESVVLTPRVVVAVESVALAVVEVLEDGDEAEELLPVAS